MNNIKFIFGLSLLIALFQLCNCSYKEYAKTVILDHKGEAFIEDKDFGEYTSVYAQFVNDEDVIYGPVFVKEKHFGEGFTIKCYDGEKCENKQVLYLVSHPGLKAIEDQVKDK
jgi:hypothetical protein